MTIEEDPLLGQFFDTPEKKAKWMARFRLAYLLWIGFVIVGILAFVLWFFLK